MLVGAQPGETLELELDPSLVGQAETGESLPQVLATVTPMRSRGSFVHATNLRPPRSPSHRAVGHSGSAKVATFVGPRN